MLAIRMQRTGRKGHAQYRVIVQESSWAPNSGRVVYRLGHFNPHTKNAHIDKEKAELYLSNGAQPSPRAASLLKKEGVKLPNWVKTDSEKNRKIRNPKKLRKNQPEEAAQGKTSEPAELENNQDDKQKPEEKQPKDNKNTDKEVKSEES